MLCHAVEELKNFLYIGLDDAMYTLAMFLALCFLYLHIKNNAMHITFENVASLIYNVFHTHYTSKYAEFTM